MIYSKSLDNICSNIKTVHGVRASPSSLSDKFSATGFEKISAKMRLKLGAVEAVPVLIQRVFTNSNLKRPHFVRSADRR